MHSKWIKPFLATIKWGVINGVIGITPIVLAVALILFTGNSHVTSLFEFLKHSKDSSSPFTAVALRTLIVAWLSYVFLGTFRHLSKVKRDSGNVSARDKLSKGVSLFLWFGISILALATGIALVRNIHKSESLASDPATKILIVPNPLPLPSASPHGEYKLVWYNHLTDNVLWEVLTTDPNITDVRNSLFNSWCKPFDPNLYTILDKETVATDEHFVRGANWWVQPPFNLPALNERWLKIMDDEKWYIFRVALKTPPIPSLPKYTVKHAPKGYDTMPSGNSVYVRLPPGKSLDDIPIAPALDNWLKSRHLDLIQEDDKRVTSMEYNSGNSVNIRSFHDVDSTVAEEICDYLRNNSKLKKIGFHSFSPDTVFKPAYFTPAKNAPPRYFEIWIDKSAF